MLCTSLSKKLKRLELVGSNEHVLFQCDGHVIDVKTKFSGLPAVMIVER